MQATHVHTLERLGLQAIDNSTDNFRYLLVFVVRPRVVAIEVESSCSERNEAVVRQVSHFQISSASLPVLEKLLERNTDTVHALEKFEIRLLFTRD